MRLLIWGAGGLGRSVLEIVRSLPDSPYREVVFIVDNLPVDTEILGVPVVGTRERLRRLDPAAYEICLASVTPSKCQAMADFIRPLGLRAATIVDPTAVVRPSASLGEGCILFPYTVVQTQAQLGRHVLLNTGVSIGHDSLLGDGCSCYAGVRVLGNCRIGRQVEIGAGAILHPGIQVGDWSRISLGSAVLSDVPAGATVASNPARVMMQGRTMAEAGLYPLEPAGEQTLGQAGGHDSR